LSDGNASSVMFLRLRRLILSKTVPNTDFEAGSRRAGQQNQIINQERKSMSNLNVTVLMGRLVRAPLSETTAPRWDSLHRQQSSLPRQSGGRPRRNRVFVACKCFGGWTDALARHQKGDVVMVEGRLRTETRKSASNSTSQPRFPSLCPKIESSSARNADGVLISNIDGRH